MDISLQFNEFNLKGKKIYIFICKNWLIVVVIYHISQVRNRTEVLISGGRGEGIWLKKQLKVNNWWSCNKWGNESNILGREKHFLPQHNLLNSIHVSLSGWFEWIVP